MAVDIDLMFRIGNKEADVYNFVYKLGAPRLDELVHAESEEAIRNFIQTVKHTEILDLKSEMAKNLIADLQEKFQPYGVYFESVAITQIKLPEELQSAFSDKTKYEIMLQNQYKKHENEKLILENTENQKMTELQRDNFRKLEEAKAAKERALIVREENKINGQAEFEVAVVDADKQASVLKTKVEGQKAIAENRGIK